MYHEKEIYKIDSFHAYAWNKVYKKEINGIPTEEILKVNIVRNLGQDDLNTILGNMRNIDSYNKYYAQAKTLKLTK